MPQKDNVKKAWIKKFVKKMKIMSGLDSAILMNPKTWGKLPGSFKDLL